MMVIFADMVEKCIKVFMDDFSVFGSSFDCCLANLERVLQRCEKTTFVLNWEKCHLMVQEGIVLGHKISMRGIEVDKAKIDVIDKLPPPVNVKGVKSFLGNVGFYKRFIKDFSKIAKPLSNLLNKDVVFLFDEECLKTFNTLKTNLMSAPVNTAPDWSQEFELMCDTSDYAVGAILGQRKGRVFHAIYYASKVLNDAQMNYATTKKEMLAIVWILLLQEFDLVIQDKKGSENLVAGHLSRLVNEEVTVKELEIRDEFPDEPVFMVNERPWFVDLANFKAAGIIPKDLTWQQRKKFLHDARFYVWDFPHLFKIGADNLLRRCVTKEEARSILWHCYNSPCGGHYSGNKTAAKVLQSRFFWPTLIKDAHEHATQCDQCQRIGGISRRNEMPL
ncbi:hypothetical protein GYH30_052585 [Glycine max]|nr:hypothetical protein GYH30_052585 [Glycine max]